MYVYVGGIITPFTLSAGATRTTIALQSASYNGSPSSIVIDSWFNNYMIEELRKIDLDPVFEQAKLLATSAEVEAVMPENRKKNAK